MGGDIENKTNIALNWRPAANADGVDAHQPEAAEVEEDELDVAGAVCRQDQLVKDAHQVSVQFFSPLHVQRAWGVRGGGKRQILSFTFFYWGGA